MFKNVLVGVDGRPGGRDAIELARRLVDDEGKLTLVHVHSGVLRPLHAATPTLVEDERRASHELLAREREAAGIEAQLVSVVSISPGRGLHQQAEDQHADLLVVGSCSHGSIGRTMLRDDTRAALNGAPCAVAVAALGYAERPTPFAKVGVGYNASPESRAALAIAHALAAPTRAVVHALEVVPIRTYAYTGIVPPAIGESIEEILATAKTRLQLLPDVEGRAVHGLVGEELAAFSGHVDILVLGSRGYGPMRRLVMGSTCDYLERHGRSSLLVLPRLAPAVEPAEEAPPAVRRAAPAASAR